MKRIIIIIFAAALLALQSCKLDFYPHNATSTENISEEDLELLYTGLYCYSQYKPTFNGYFQNDMAGGDFRRNKASGYSDPATWIKDCILVNSGWMSGPWTGYYAWLYQVNNFIKMAEAAERTEKVSNMLGAAYFFRGLIYYNLTSKYRNVPLLREPTNDAVPNTPEGDLWAFVEEDLNKAIEMCPGFTSKYFVSNEAAKALMARAKLAQNKKKEAAALADEVIGSPLFSLDDFEKIFRNIENNEEILTFSNLQEENGINFCNQYYLPGGQYFPTTEVISLFLPADKRTSITLMQDGSETCINKYPSKSSTDPINILRLAEMYLISAEGNGISGGGLQRLNDFRASRGLGAVSPAPTTDQQLIDAVLDERRKEFLAEGFRWFDLVRTGKYTQKLGLDIKYTIFPIPQRELDLNSKLEQNLLWK